MKVCLVLGAGAPLANAVHIQPKRQRNPRPPLDTTFFRAAGTLPTTVLNYFAQLLGTTSVNDRLQTTRMEEAFKDLYFDLSEHPSNVALQDAYIDLVRTYIRVLRDTTNWLCEDERKGAPIGALIARSGPLADATAIVTFNHDLVIENELYKRPDIRRRWCLDHGYGTFNARLTPIFPVGNERQFHLHEDGRCNHARLSAELALMVAGCLRPH